METVFAVGTQLPQIHNFCALLLFAFMQQPILYLPTRWHQKIKEILILCMASHTLVLSASLPPKWQKYSIYDTDPEICRCQTLLITYSFNKE